MRRPVLAPIVRRIRTLLRRVSARGGAKFRAASALCALAISPGLSGCILGSERPALSLDVPEAYRFASRRDANASVPALDWWRGFRSSELTTLMDAAQVHNLDIAVAIAQIVQADAQVGISGAPLLPTVSGSASAEREHFGSTSSSGASLSGGGLGGGGLGGGGGGGRGSTFSIYTTSLTASYILDFWGKNRATLAASEESATASRYNRE